MKVHNNINKKTYTGKDLLEVARRMMGREMSKMQGRPLTEKEEEKVNRVAQGISVEVLKEMGVFS